MISYPELVDKALQRGHYERSSIWRETVAVILSPHPGAPAPGQHLGSRLGDRGEVRKGKNRLNTALPPRLNLAFADLKFIETLMKYQMTPKFKFNGSSNAPGYFAHPFLDCARVKWKSLYGSSFLRRKKAASRRGVVAGERAVLSDVPIHTQTV